MNMEMKSGPGTSDRVRELFPMWPRKKESRFWSYKDVSTDLLKQVISSLVSVSTSIKWNNIKQVLENYP